MAASSLRSEDLARFRYIYVGNDELFVGCTLTQGNSDKMDALEVRVARHIKLYTRVVPYPIIQERCEEAERPIVEGNENFSQKLQDTVNQECIVSAKEVLSLVDKYINDQRLHFLLCYKKSGGWSCWM